MNGIDLAQDMTGGGSSWMRKMNVRVP